MKYSIELPTFASCNNKLTMNNHVDNNHKARVNEDVYIEDNITMQSHEERFQCNECDSYFAYPYTLQLHIKTIILVTNSAVKAIFRQHLMRSMKNTLICCKILWIILVIQTLVLYLRRGPLHIHDSSPETSISR